MGIAAHHEFLPSHEQSGGKMWLRGTHRVCGPDETFARIEPLLPRMGITRLADITWLDDIGLPVYQAVRPNAYLLSVSQGKGLSPELAKVSAAMEAVEGWHAERPPVHHTGTVDEFAEDLGYRLHELNLAARHHLNPAVCLEWSAATRLSDGSVTFVPTDYVRLDGRVGNRWTPRLFETSSNGLASGNTLDEATLHGLYEVVEREALVSEVAPRLLALNTVDGSSGEVLDLLRRADIRVSVQALHSPTGLPCFRALIRGDLFPATFEGSGCHLDRDVALCRALTEAAQSRLTVIAGTRDDMPEHLYHRTDDVDEADAPLAVARSASGPAEIPFDDIESLSTPSIADDLRLVAGAVRAHTGRDVLMTDHTRAEFGIPVVHVVCPGLRYGTA